MAPEQFKRAGKDDLAEEADSPWAERTSQARGFPRWGRLYLTIIPPERQIPAVDGVDAVDAASHLDKDLLLAPQVNLARKTNDAPLDVDCHRLWIDPHVFEDHVLGDLLVDVLVAAEERSQEVVPRYDSHYPLILHHRKAVHLRVEQDPHSDMNGHLRRNSNHGRRHDICGPDRLASTVEPPEAAQL